jgi:hypothetical protein
MRIYAGSGLVTSPRVQNQADRSPTIIKFGYRFGPAIIGRVRVSAPTYLHHPVGLQVAGRVYDVCSGGANLNDHTANGSRRAVLV